MGVLTELVMAAPSEAKAILASDSRLQTWEGFDCKGLDDVHLISLWALVEAGDPDDRFEERSAQVQVLSESDQGPWAIVVPTGMLESLARVAHRPQGEFDSLVAAWAGTEEFEGWDPGDVSTLLRRVANLAERARLRTRTIVLWKCL